MWPVASAAAVSWCQSTKTTLAQQHRSYVAQLHAVCLNFDSQNDCWFALNDSWITHAYSEITDLTWDLHCSLICLRLVACKIQKIARCPLHKKIWLQIFAWLSQCSENALPSNPVCRQCICHYFYLLTWPWYQFPDCMYKQWTFLWAKYVPTLSTARSAA